MPRSARYSAATKQLAADLAARGHKVGCRALEHWAELGLAPPPIRYSRGRHGFSSQYPPGAVDQYAAVASVMRRGLDWRVAGLLLIGQGHLPTSEPTFRLLLEFLPPDDIDTTDDPLGQAEEAVAQSARDPLFARLILLAKSNLSAARIVDPVTKQVISTESAAIGVMTRIFAGMLGDMLPEGAAEEIAAALGLIEPGLAEEERLDRTNYVEAIFSGPLTFRELSRTVATVKPAKLQATVLAIRKSTAEHQIEGLELFPPALLDLWMIVLALMDIIIDDLGGFAWFRSMGVVFK